MAIPDMHLVLHGFAIKKHGTIEDVASLIGLPQKKVEALVAKATGAGKLVEGQGRYMLSPTARMALDGEYSRHYGDLRTNEAFVAAYEQFEKINVTLKSLITDWQTMSVGGERVPNDHSDSAYDERIIDKLGELHERADVVLKKLAAGLPRLSIYADKLESALDKAEDGEHSWVSDARTESYHTVWFELHEELLRLMGRERVE